jgi:hypothetical protein
LLSPFDCPALSRIIERLGITEHGEEVGGMAVHDQPNRSISYRREAVEAWLEQQVDKRS